MTMDIIFVNLLSSMSTALFNITFASFFNNETSGLNFIGLFNMIVSITGSYGIDNPYVRSLKKLLPQNFMITYFGDILKAKGNTKHLEYFTTLGSQCLVYLILFYTVEKFLPNEYGY
jgi:ABC-type multidrug transport system ATPase subunit